ncbi:MAG: polymer-forming cytoskeletal protein [Flavobacteriales bacterium]|nr:polymer-forming cytoskeletal protein [Flavobacteriales bacterium]
MNNSNQDQVTHNTIAAGTIIEGKIVTQGDIRVDGTIKGSIICEGKIVVGESGVIEGETKCRNANISGTIKAKINVTELLALRATAKLIGDIVADKLSVEPGAIFTGACKMDSTVIKDINTEDTGAAVTPVPSMVAGEKTA